MGRGGVGGIGFGEGRTWVEEDEAVEEKGKGWGGARGVGRGIEKEERAGNGWIGEVNGGGRGNKA